MKKIRILFVFGTRPEAIKMAPIILQCREKSTDIEPVVCVTGQHKEMLQQVLDFFEIKPDYDLALMRPNQTLAELTASVLAGVNKIISEVSPDIILVQGDTTTAMAGALAGFYNQVPVGHVEAGLRSGNNLSPFPEEVNRKIIGTMATLHFAPTVSAADNLKKEDHRSGIFVTGNTVIDALLWGVQKVRDSENIAKEFSFLKASRPIILITAHRRESFGKPFEEICTAILDLAKDYQEYDFVYPVHLNPNVRKTVFKRLEGEANIFLIEPVGYPHLIWLMDHAYIVITDSGGIQEEAPALGKPVLVLREVTERQEGIDAGTAVLVGTDSNKIVASAKRLLDDRSAYDAMAKAVNPYGNGASAGQILSIIINGGA